MYKKQIKEWYQIIRGSHIHQTLVRLMILWSESYLRMRLLILAMPLSKNSLTQTESVCYDILLETGNRLSHAATVLTRRC